MKMNIIEVITVIFVIAKIWAPTFQDVSWWIVFLPWIIKIVLGAIYSVFVEHK